MVRWNTIYEVIGSKSFQSRQQYWSILLNAGEMILENIHPDIRGCMQYFDIQGGFIRGRVAKMRLNRYKCNVYAA